MDNSLSLWQYGTVSETTYFAFTAAAFFRLSSSIFCFIKLFSLAHLAPSPFVSTAWRKYGKDKAAHDNQRVRKMFKRMIKSGLGAERRVIYRCIAVQYGPILLTIAALVFKIVFFVRDTFSFRRFLSKFAWSLFSLIRISLLKFSSNFLFRASSFLFFNLLQREREMPLVHGTHDRSIHVVQNCVYLHDQITHTQTYKRTHTHTHREQIYLCTLYPLAHLIGLLTGECHWPAPWSRSLYLRPFVPPPAASHTGQSSKKVSTYTPLSEWSNSKSI